MITLLYSGNIGIGQDIATILRAVARLHCNGDLRIVIVGSGKGLSSIRQLVRQLQLRNVEFREPVPLSQLSGLLIGGEIHLILQKPGTEGLLVPSKVYGTLAAGRPSLFVGPSNCEVSRIISESRSGLVVDAGDVEGVVNALRTLVASATLRQEMGNNARQYYERHFGRQRSVSKIIDILERAAEPRVEENGDRILFQSLREKEVSRMANDRPRRKSLVAAVTASLFVFAFGLSFRALAGQFSHPVGRPPIEGTALEQFPMEIHGWRGQDIALDNNVRSLIGAEVYVNRCYSHRDSLESVSLFVAASSMRRATLVGHPPELCNVGAGWALASRRLAELPLANGGKLPCTIFEFSQSRGLEGQRKTVLCFYIAAGQYCGSRRVLQSRLRWRSSDVNYVAQVQIAAVDEVPAGDCTDELVCTFATDSAPIVARSLERMEVPLAQDEPAASSERERHEM